MTFRFWKRKVLIIFCLFVLIVVLYLNHKKLNDNFVAINIKLGPESHRKTNSNVILLTKFTTIDTNLIDIEGVYDKKLLELSELKKCDICLGTEFCPTFMTNVLVTNTPYVLNDLTYRRAVIKNTNQKLTILSQSSDKWSKLESIICRNASQSLSSCDHSLAVRNSFAAKSDLFSIQNYREFFRQIKSKDYANHDKQSDSLLQATFSQCATKKYLQLLQNSFDANNDKFMDLFEQSHLLSSLLAFPGYAVHRMVDKFESDIQILKIKGVCGRLLVFDGNYQTIDDFIKEQNSFEVMAGLVVQIIQLIDDLQEEDPNWFYLQTELTYDSFVVSSEGEVFLSDLNKMVVIDKSLFDEQTLRSRQSLLHSQVCNEPCFHTFHLRFLNAFNTSSILPSLECSHIHLYYGQHMYAMICRNIFSSVDLNSDDNRIKQTAIRTGLLKSVPNKDKENVDDLLRECIYETSPGGRKQAIDELRDLLKGYLHFEENDDQNNENNANEDDEDNEDHNDVNNDNNNN